MKALRFTEAQIAFVLRQAEEGTAIGEVCRHAQLRQASLDLIRSVFPPGKGIRLVGVTVSNFETPAHEGAGLPLFGSAVRNADDRVSVVAGAP